METILISLVIVLMGSLAFLFYKIKNSTRPIEQENKLFFEYIEALRKELRETSLENRKETQERLDKIQERLAKGLELSSNTIQKQFTQSSKLIVEVTEKLAKLDATNKQVLSFSEKMQSLEDILKNPKKRGILGEYFLENLLSHVLQPNQYKMQYEFSNGEKVDAAIFFRDKIIPIDAKFSLEKYNLIMEENDDRNREKLEKEFKIDIKNRIDETSKYIRQNENTTDFSFMFIPAEGVYYSLLTYKVNEQLKINANDLIEYAFKKHVIIVSPTSFFAYLETVLQGLKAMKMEESIKEVVKNVGQLGKHLKIYEECMQKLGGHLGTTVNSYNCAYKEFHKIDKDVYRITNGNSGGTTEVIMVERPGDLEA